MTLEDRIQREETQDLSLSDLDSLQSVELFVFCVFQDSIKTVFKTKILGFVIILRNMDSISRRWDYRNLLKALRWMRGMLAIPLWIQL
jgi:hypothetical protein